MSLANEIRDPATSDDRAKRVGALVDSLLLKVDGRQRDTIIWTALAKSIESVVAKRLGTAATGGAARSEHDSELDWRNPNPEAARAAMIEQARNAWRDPPLHDEAAPPAYVIAPAAELVAEVLSEFSWRVSWEEPNEKLSRSPEKICAALDAWLDVSRQLRTPSRRRIYAPGRWNVFRDLAEVCCVGPLPEPRAMAQMYSANCR